MRITRDPSPMQAAANRENIRMDISHAEGIILQELMSEIQGIKGWCQRDMRVQELVTNLVVHLPQGSDRERRTLFEGMRAAQVVGPR